MPLLGQGLAISGHGTIIARAPFDTPSEYTDIAELAGDVGVPELSRKEIDASTQNRDIDSYVLGMLRRSGITFPINYIASDPTHDPITGLYAAIASNQVDGYRVTFPDGEVWIMSGQVSKIAKKAPVDDRLVADVTVRPTGAFFINDILIGGTGAAAALAKALSARGGSTGAGALGGVGAPGGLGGR